MESGEEEEEVEVVPIETSQNVRCIYETTSRGNAEAWRTEL